MNQSNYLSVLQPLHSTLNSGHTFRDDTIGENLLENQSLPIRGTVQTMEVTEGTPRVDTLE